MSGVNSSMACDHSALRHTRVQCATGSCPIAFIFGMALRRSQMSSMSDRWNSRRRSVPFS